MRDRRSRPLHARAADRSAVREVCQHFPSRRSADGCLRAGVCVGSAQVAAASRDVRCEARHCGSIVVLLARSSDRDFVSHPQAARRFHLVRRSFKLSRAVLRPARRPFALCSGVRRRVQRCALDRRARRSPGSDRGCSRRQAAARAISRLVPSCVVDRPGGHPPAASRTFPCVVDFRHLGVGRGGRRRRRRGASSPP